MTTCEQSQPKDFEQMELTGLTSFAVASPVNRFPLPGSSKARTITVTSGRKCLGLYRKQSPIGSLVKMLLVSSVWHSARCLLTWKASGTKSNRLLFQLVPSMPPIDEIEFGLLPTPLSTLGTHGGPNQRDSSGRPGLQMAVAKMWHTPRAVMPEETPEKFRARMNSKRPNDRKNGFAHLSMQVQAMYATPTAQDAKNSTLPVSQRDRDSIPGNLLQQGQTGQLSPLFVEWLMGYPEGWTDLKPSETR